MLKLWTVKSRAFCGGAGLKNEGRGRKSFFVLIAAGLCHRLPTHGFPIECAGLVYQLTFLDSGIGYSCPSA